MKMKLISCMIWVLGSFFIIAALDTRPDPPAVNPTAASCKAVSLHDNFVRPAVRGCDSLFASDPSLIELVAVDPSDPRLPANPLVLTGHAADSSPPEASQSL
jgi:hypothetical protein